MEKGDGLFYEFFGGHRVGGGGYPGDEKGLILFTMKILGRMSDADLREIECQKEAMVVSGDMARSCSC